MPAPRRLPVVAAAVTVTVMVAGFAVTPAFASGALSAPTAPVQVPVEIHAPSAAAPRSGDQAQSATPLGRAGEALEGTFALTAGSCSGNSPAGSYFRMITPAGQVGSGPYVGNPNSSCGDNTYTVLSPGTDGGLLTTGYQALPSPGFDSNGNAKAARIIKPTSFNGVAFSISTNATDPQTTKQVPVPAISADGGALSGDLSAVSAHWNSQHFNQGAPKPGGAYPGQTRKVSGTYNATTGAFTLEWASQIEGGPFNNFTGFWHLTGTFRPAGGGGGTTSSTAGAGSSTTGTVGTGGAAGTGDSAATSASPTALESAAAGGNGSLPKTGGPLALGPGLVLMGSGLAGMATRRRTRRPA